MPKATKESPKKAAPKKGGVKKAKKEKDPNAPKKPMTAYFLWLQENRESIKKANPNASVTEISKLAGVEWGKLSASDKKKYEDAAAKDKARYEKEMAAYKKSA